MEHVEVHPANQAEVNKLPGIVDDLVEQGVQPEGVLANKGLCKRGQPRLSEGQKHRRADPVQRQPGQPRASLADTDDRAIATLRYKVEQGFGTMKRRFHVSRARYFGAAKTQAQMARAPLGLHLVKVMRKLQSGRLQPCTGSRPS